MMPEELRIGLVGPLPPPNGGMAMQMEQLEKLLQNENIQVEKLATNLPYRPSWIARIRGVRALFRLCSYVFKAWSLAGRVQLIHVLANSGWSWQLFSAPIIWIGWLRGTPVVVNYRGGEALSYFQRSFARVRPSLNKAHTIVVPSAYLKDVFSQFGIKTCVISNIIDTGRFCPADHPTSLNSFSLIVTRNLEPIYGLETAISAVSLVKDAIPEIGLTIAGSGPQLLELETLVDALGLNSHVTFAGRLDSQKIVSLYQSADVMLNPTTVDNMPNSVLEALACGVPVISTDVGGVPYMVKHEITALLVPVGRPQEMADAILRLYKDSDLRTSLIRAGVDEVQQYTWTNIREQWLGLYLRTVMGVCP
jgi:glycosyltransferase involved in cell wall biosynthesis